VDLKIKIPRKSGLVFEIPKADENFRFKEAMM
jgi:hypothetical protein